MALSLSDVLSVPESRILVGFTTSTLVTTPPGVVVPLSDKELGVHKVTSATTHQRVRPPVPVGGDAAVFAWEAFYPEGSINPGNKAAPPGGFGFYLGGPPPFAGALNDLGTTSGEVVMSYDVLLEDNFAFRKGGKLPGLYGGAGNSAYGCTGGRQTDRCKCFNLRLMWRENGVGELYAYAPQLDTNTRQLLAVPPRSIQHPDFGFSVGRGSWSFEPGKWTRVVQRVKVNDLGEENGELEVTIDGKSVILVAGLVLRTQEGPDARVQGIHFQTFFGGHTTEWASPRDQSAWFASISGAVLAPMSSTHTTRDEL
ncbi:hypothetical protein C8Q78DRAFT_1056133 [Trametes maxima]|nr:hypothetical protein C8Q78DRAFT_1056133 [Trametes maxima]